MRDPTSRLSVVMDRHTSCIWRYPVPEVISATDILLFEDVLTSKGFSWG